MPAIPAPHNEGARLYEELLAVHAIMRRGNALVADSYARLAAGDPVDPATLVATTRWLTAFVHHHHQSEDALLWPVLAERFPEAVAELDRLTEEHEVLDAELDNLARAADSVAAEGSAKGRGGGGTAAGRAAVGGRSAAAKVQDILARHLDAEEPVLGELFPRVPDGDIVRLRKAIVDGAPRSGPHLVFGLMEDPEPVPGHAHMYGNFPAPLRWGRPLLLRRYRAALGALGATARTRSRH